MRVVAGERSVTIGLTYDQAEWLLSKLTPGDELYAKLGTKIPAARAKGFPLPPLPRSNVAHNSEVEIVDDVSRRTKG